MASGGQLRPRFLKIKHNLKLRHRFLKPGHQITSPSWNSYIVLCLLVLNAGNFREWSQSSLVMSSSQQPPATRPATLRKTHQDLPSIAEELAMTSLVCCKASTTRWFGIKWPLLRRWKDEMVDMLNTEDTKDLRWFKHLKSLHTGDMMYIYIYDIYIYKNWYDGCSTEPLWHALTMNSSTSHECSSQAGVFKALYHARFHSLPCCKGLETHPNLARPHPSKAFRIL